MLQYAKTTLYDRKQNVVKVWACHRNSYVGYYTILSSGIQDPGIPHSNFGKSELHFF
jgi:hypothetical protein